MTSTFAERKLHTIELLAKLEDEELLLLIEQLLVDALGADWANGLSDAAKASIRTGIAQLDLGEGDDLELFKKRMQSKYP